MRATVGVFLPVLTASVWAKTGGGGGGLAVRQWRDEVAALTCSFLPPFVFNAGVSLALRGVK